MGKVAFKASEGDPCALEKQMELRKVYDELARSVAIMVTPRPNLLSKPSMTWRRRA